MRQYLPADMPELWKGNAKMKTIIHYFDFDVATVEGRRSWQEFKAERLAEGVKIHGPVLSDDRHRRIDGQEIELETEHLFNNQWNTKPVEGYSDKGLRVFDFYLQSDSAPHAASMSAPRGVRRGHWLEQTAEMKEIRRNTAVCGYCGKQEPAAKGYVFCPHCIDSEYLKESDLPLTRMVPVCDTDQPRAKLTEAEKAYLLPLFHAAQLHGSTEKGKARIAAQRASMLKKRDGAIKHANAEYDGFIWFMDRGIKTDNLIYYSHIGRFSFGWRQPVTAEFKASILEIISEFPFAYEIKCADGTTLAS
jgi:hypothetical protein